jgi:hypothetical protein
MGYRDDALPIIVYVTDNYLRDPEAGYGSPGGCPLDAGQTDVTDAATAAGAMLVGIATSGIAVGQMIDLALATGSLADLDADGMRDDPLVFSVAYSGSAAAASSAVQAAVVDAVFNEVTLVVLYNPAGVDVTIAPVSYTSVPAGTALPFDISVSGTVYAEPTGGTSELVLGMFADGRFLLDRTTLYVSP